MPRQGHHHDEFEANQFLGKEMQYFSQAGFDLDRIHIKVGSPISYWLAHKLIPRCSPPPSLFFFPHPASRLFCSL